MPRPSTGFCAGEPRIPLDTIHGLPVWKPETLLAYMGARPARFPWTDIAEWLWEPCENVDTHLLAAELEGRPPAAWARTAYLLERGERPDAAADLAASGPCHRRRTPLFWSPRQRRQI